MTETEKDHDRILVVDDNLPNLQLLEGYLENAGYEVIPAGNGIEALEKLNNGDGDLPDLVLLDVMMPGLNGFQVCQTIKNNRDTHRIPVMLLTALSGYEDKLRGFEAGADEFLTKPIERLELLLRVKSLLRNKHLHEDLESARDVIYSLALAIEANDPYTRGHSERVAVYGARLALRMGLDNDQQQTIRNAGILHDIGKIGISDAIMQKPGPLTDEELLAIQEHPAIGEKICSPLRSANLLLTIIRHHQERYDGRGYPDGLSGRDIPMEARIITVCDAFDAMTSPRPYRPPMSRRQAAGTLKREAGRQWDPVVVGEFLKLLEEEENEQPPAAGPPADEPIS